MVRHYKPKGLRVSYTDEQLQLALDSIRNGKSIKSCATAFGIPRTTLQRKMHFLSSKTTGFSKTFTDEQEKVLYNYIIDMEEKLMGLSSMDVRRLAYDYATKLGLSHNFNQRIGLTGKDWLNSFMHRHNLANRKAEPTSAARANGFNQDAVQKFFGLLKDVQNKYKFSASNIYNVDETGVSIVPKSGSRVIAQKGRRQVGGKTAAERGETVSAEICMSAAGSFMPPMLIFPRVKVNEEYLQNKPEGSWAIFRKSGWMETDIFTEWFKKFIKFSNASVDNPVLLLLDGHQSHVKNLEIAELGKSNGVVVLCFPPHCTHKMQPLDVAFMKPLTTYYAEEIKNFQRTGIRVQMKDIFGIFGKAWQKAAKIETAVNAFRKTGITPFDANIFYNCFIKSNDQNSFSSQRTSPDTEGANRTQEYENVIHDIMSSSASSSFPSCNPTANGPEPSVTMPLSYIIQAKPLLSLLNSAIVQQMVNTSDEPNNNEVHFQSNLLNITAEDRQEKTISRKRGSAAVVTSDEYLTELQHQKLKKIKKEPQEKKKFQEKKEKPKIISDVIVKEVEALPKKAVPNRINVPKRQPLTELNYQFLTTNVVNLAPAENFQKSYYLQTDDGSLKPLSIKPISIQDFQTQFKDKKISPVNFNIKQVR